MTALRSLVLANNLLETLPASLGKLIRLTNLDLSNNQARFCPLRPRRGAHDTRA
jgi:Leucine-rich repeat (LRR) protein